MQLVFVANGISNIRDGKRCHLEQFGSLCHAVADQKFLWRFSYRTVKDLSEITAVDTAKSRNIFHSDVVLKILFNEADRFLYVKITHSAALNQSCGAAGV